MNKCLPALFSVDKFSITVTSSSNKEIHVFSPLLWTERVRPPAQESLPPGHEPFRGGAWLGEVRGNDFLMTPNFTLLDKAFLCNSARKNYISNRVNPPPSKGEEIFKELDTPQLCCGVLHLGFGIWNLKQVISTLVLVFGLPGQGLFNSSG
jgi:hypothetical protein